MSPDSTLLINTEPPPSPAGSTSGDSGYDDDLSCKDSVKREPPKFIECFESPKLESPTPVQPETPQLKLFEPPEPLFIPSDTSDPKVETTSSPVSQPKSTFFSSETKLIVTTAKVVVLGNSGVGKTSIIYSHRFNMSGVQLHAATIGASYVKVLVDIGDNRQVQLQVWDTAGQERFRCMVPMYTRNAAAAFVFYDICSRASFQDVDKWVNDLRRCSGDHEPDVVLIGNKNDRENDREVTTGEGQIKAMKLNAMFFELNAHTPAGFNSVLDVIADKVHRRMEDPEPEPSDSGYDSQSSSTLNSPVIRLDRNSPVMCLDPKQPKKAKRECCALL